MRQTNPEPPSAEMGLTLPMLPRKDWYAQTDEDLGYLADFTDYLK